MRIPLPPVLLPAETARVALEHAAGRRTPAPPRDAATVVLMRASAQGPEVYLLRRQSSMAFAAGMAVFPGGGVDPRDGDAALGWAGPSPAVWADALGCTEEEARALVCAAVRETFEECGVLLAGPSPDEVVADVSGADWEADRVALESREVSLSALLERRGLVLRSDLLGAWAAWTTPEFEPRRYRTWFFVAALPEGQRTRDVSSESASVVWLPALAAAEAAEQGTLALMPPTYLTCLDVAAQGSPEEVLAAARGRRVEMFTPAVEEVDGGHALTLLPRHRELLAGRGRV
jgi:8-oxo-dGTP pyrophosphatase MutT (NUDIX family)